MDLVGLVIADTALLLALDMSTALMIWMTGSMTVVPPPPTSSPLSDVLCLASVGYVHILSMIASCIDIPLRSKT